MGTTLHAVRRTDVLDLKRGDVIVYRTHKSETIYKVVNRSREDMFGKVRLTLRKRSESGRFGKPQTFTTSGVSRFERLGEVQS
jgi:hypothetical protein